MIDYKIKEEVIIHTDEYYYTIIRKNIKNLRKKNGLTQQDLADLTNISREYICDVENESRNKHITIAFLGRIADALETDISYFFEEHDEKK